MDGAERARRFLEHVREGEYFRLADGRVIKNLRELAILLDTLSEDLFRQHVSEVKNDFADWIEQSIGDAELAARLRLSTDYNHFREAVHDRISELEAELLAEKMQEDLGGKHEHEEREADLNSVVDDAERLLEEELRALEQELSMREETPSEGEASRTLPPSVTSHSLSSSPPPAQPAGVEAVPQHEPSDQRQDGGVMLPPPQADCEKQFYWTDFLIGLAAGVLVGVLTAFLYTLLTSGGP